MRLCCSRILGSDIFDGICFRTEIEFKFCFLRKMIRCPLAREPPMRGGMLSDAAHLSGHKPQHMPARHALQQGFNYPCGWDTQVGPGLPITQLYLLHWQHQQLFIPGRPPGPTQSGCWSVQPSEFQFRWNWGARCDLHVNYSPRAFRPIMAACPPTSHQSLELGAPRRDQAKA